VVTPPGTTLRNVRIADDLWTAAQARAREDGATVSEVVRELLRLWLADEVVCWPVDSDIT
jgi:hypothetical protein